VEPAQRLTGANYSRRVPAQARLVLAVAVFTVLVSIGVCAGAVLAPAPPMAVPLVVVTCVGSSAFAGWEVPRALRAERIERGKRPAVAAQRKSLEQLPETEHPLGP
jgi:hypothetical protein